MPANGSKSVALDIGASSDFIGQFNINYNANDGVQRKYVSPLFNVIHHPGAIIPVTWNQQALSALTRAIRQTASAQRSTMASATTSALTSSHVSKTADPTPHLAAASTDRPITTPTVTSALEPAGTPENSNPNSHSAVTIGLGVGITLGIAALGLIGFLYWGKRKRMKPDLTRSPGTSQNPITFVNEWNTVGELDAHHRHVKLSDGRLDAELDDGRPTL